MKHAASETELSSLRTSPETAIGMDEEEGNPLLEASCMRSHSPTGEPRFKYFYEALKGVGQVIEISKPAMEFSPSLMIVGLITFAGDCSRGVLFPVLWNLCQYCGGNLVNLGYLIAIFSFGRFIATLPLGYFCDRYRHKLSLIIASVVLGFGALLWANVSVSRNIGLLYFAQFLLGCGSGSLGVTRSYVVEQVAPKDRTECLAYLTALQYAGFTVSPIVGAALTSLGASWHSPYWEFGLPPYFLALLTEACVVLLCVVFKDIETKDGSSSAPAKGTKAAPPKAADPNVAQMFLIVTVLFICLNVTVRGSIAVYETMGAEIWANDYRLNTVTLGTLVTCSGGLGTLQLLLFKYLWTSRFDDVTLILIGAVIMIVGQLIMHSYGPRFPLVGQFVVSLILMYGFGYPLAQTATLGAFSKLQKAGPQAALMSYFATAGSFARIVIPIVTGYMDKVEDNSPFVLIVFMVAASYAAVTLLKSTIYYCLSPTLDLATAVAPPVTLRGLWAGLSPKEAAQVVLAGAFAVGAVLIFVLALDYDSRLG